MPIALHNVSGLLLNMACQQFAAATHNCPRIECSRGSDKPKRQPATPRDVNGKMKVSTLPGLGLDLNLDYLKANAGRRRAVVGIEKVAYLLAQHSELQAAAARRVRLRPALPGGSGPGRLLLLPGRHSCQRCPAVQEEALQARAQVVEARFARWCPDETGTWGLPPWHMASTRHSRQ